VFRQWLNEQNISSNTHNKLSPYGFSIDNPGGGWLASQRKRAMLNKTRGDVTAVADSIPMSVDELLMLPGEEGEHLAMDTELAQHKIKELANSIKNKGLEYGPMVWVSVNGRASVAEGNHRIRAAKLAKMDTIPVQFRWFAGSEQEQYGKHWSADQIANRI